MLAKGEHNGRWWVLETDDVEAVARLVKSGATDRMIAASLNVNKPSHPKMVKALALARKATPTETRP